MILRVSGESIILEIIRDPIELAIAGKKFASVKPNVLFTKFGTKRSFNNFLNRFLNIFRHVLREKQL